MATITTTTTYNEIPIGVNFTVQLTAQDGGLYYLGIEDDSMEVIGTSIATAAANMTLDSSNYFLYTYTSASSDPGADPSWMVPVFSQGSPIYAANSAYLNIPVGGQYSYVDIFPPLQGVLGISTDGGRTAPLTCSEYTSSKPGGDVDGYDAFVLCGDYLMGYPSASAATVLGDSSTFCEDAGAGASIPIGIANFTAILDPPATRPTTAAASAIPTSSWDSTSLLPATASSTGVCSVRVKLYMETSWVTPGATAAGSGSQAATTVTASNVVEGVTYECVPSTLTMNN